MKGNVLRDLVTIVKGVKNLLGHSRVKVVHCPYLGGNKGPMATIVYLAYDSVTLHMTFLVTSLSLFPLLLLLPLPPPPHHPSLLLLLPHPLHTLPFPHR